MELNDSIREMYFRDVQNVFSADLNYQEALSITHECGTDTVIQALPNDLKSLLFFSRQPKYSYLSILKGSSYLIRESLPVETMKGTEEAWWREYGIGLIAEAILVCAPRTAQRFNAEKVKKYVAQYESVLDGFACYAYANSFFQNNAFYRRRYRCHFIPHEIVVEIYAKLMEGIAPIRAIWAATGMWPNMRQEIYHHSIKMITLYFTPSEIDAVLTRAKQAGMPIPDDLGPGMWYKCKEFCGNGRWLSAEDLLTYCRAPLTECRDLPLQGWWDVRMSPFEIREYGADVFFGKYGKRFY